MWLVLFSQVLTVSKPLSKASTGIPRPPVSAAAFAIKHCWANWSQPTMASSSALRPVAWRRNQCCLPQAQIPPTLLSFLLHPRIPHPHLEWETAAQVASLQLQEPAGIPVGKPYKQVVRSLLISLQLQGGQAPFDLKWLHAPLRYILVAKSI